MSFNHLLDFKENIITIVGSDNVLTDEKDTLSYRTGIRVGSGTACAVIFPQSLLEMWKVLQTCIAFEKIIIMQAANTGLTGGSTPDGQTYDRDVVIINTLSIDQLLILHEGDQVVAFPGTTLYQLEDRLLPLGRGPHSVIGSSCIGASVVGGVCNNSGGNLVNRGPAYTQLSLFARLNKDRKLELVNHLGINLGIEPEEILTNLEGFNFNKEDIKSDNLMASDIEYQSRVRDINANTPARFNADPRRLYESSGCAGKIAVFAVRLDTFPTPKEEKVFFVGTNQPTHFTELRKKILLDFVDLPDMGEYMHRSYFDGAMKYCKDIFLVLKYLGTHFLPKLLKLKRKVDAFTTNNRFLPSNFFDKLMQWIANILPNHLPKRIIDYRNRFEHYMIFSASDDSIKLTKELLDYETSKIEDFEYFMCKPEEGRDLLLHRYVAGAAPARYQVVNSSESGELLPLDVALPRNCINWHDILPSHIHEKMAQSFQMGHFLCMVFHWDFVVKKEVDVIKLKEEILDILDQKKARYPAEHNVGHLYKADLLLENFYRGLDPTNTFNPGIGKSSKNSFYN